MKRIILISLIFFLLIFALSGWIYFKIFPFEIAKIKFINSLIWVTTLTIIYTAITFLGITIEHKRETQWQEALSIIKNKDYTQSINVNEIKIFHLYDENNIDDPFYLLQIFREVYKFRHSEADCQRVSKNVIILTTDHFALILNQSTNQHALYRKQYLPRN